MTKKIIFFDVDGTLVSHAGKSHIPEPTAEALQKLAQNGHTLAIATARNWGLTRKTAALCGIRLAVCCNGAHILRDTAGNQNAGVCPEQNLHEAWLGDDFIRAFGENAFSVSRHAYALDADCVYTDWTQDFLDAFIAEQAGPGRKKKLAGLRRAQLAYIFAPPPPQWRDFSSVDIIETSDYTEFRPLGASKWSGVSKAASASGFRPEDIVTVGDGLNDIDMVENAPLGIAVGKAKEELKAAADFVAEDIDQGGILSAFRSLGMI